LDLIPIYLIRGTDVVKGGKRQGLKKTLADINLSFFNLEIGIASRLAQPEPVSVVSVDTQAAID
jgi:hypothetical protein